MNLTPAQLTLSTVALLAATRGGLLTGTGQAPPTAIAPSLSMESCP